MNRLLSAALNVGMAGALLWVVVTITSRGFIQFQEPSVPILVGEVLLLIGILIYGVVNFILLCRR